MKFLHTSDLHLGRRFNDISLLGNQAIILNQIIEIAKDELCDAVIIAGDIYDKASPIPEAMELFNQFVDRLIENNLKVYLISGNHDSASRITYYSNIIRKSNIFVSNKFNGIMQKETFTDEYGDIDIYYLPFIKPIQVRAIYQNSKITTYEEAIQKVLEKTKIDYSHRTILLAHQYMTGAQISESEELQIGGLDQIDATIFNGFDYVALGHLHSPQKVLKETIRYSGSPLKYSFSEINNKNQVVIVDFKEKGNVIIKPRYLTNPHLLRILKGPFSEIYNLPYSEDYVKVILTDEDIAPDARVTISTVFPNMMKFGVENSKTKFDRNVNAKEEMENKTPIELFCDFYQLQNNGELPSSEKIEYLEKLINEIRGENK